MNTWLKFASMNRSRSPIASEENVGETFRIRPERGFCRTRRLGAGSGRPLVMFAYCKHLWGVNSREEAFQPFTIAYSELFAASYQREMEGRRLAKDDAKLVYGRRF